MMRSRAYIENALDSVVTSSHDLLNKMVSVATDGAGRLPW